MTNPTDRCEDYFEDPDAHASHLASCALCRATAEELDAALDVQSRPIAVDGLPVASWEGAAHRPWPLVAAGFTAVLILAVALFLAAGTPPLRGVARAATSSLTSFEGATRLFQLVGNGLHSAPAVVHVTIAVLFVSINTLLFVLLRRSPKGIDV
jgi:hypothetical protein